MARTTTAPQRALLAAAQVNHYAWVEVTDADGTWQDLTTLGGEDWFDEFTYDEAIDRPVIQGTVNLRRETNAASLAPTMGGSALNRNAHGDYAALLDVGRLIRITTAVTAPGAAPVTADKKVLVIGVIDEVNWAADPIQVTWRDLGAQLLDRWMERVATYGSTDAGTAVEVIMANIIQNAADNIADIYTPVSPGWMILAYSQAQKNVMEALRDLALQIGWDLRYRYDAADVFRLTFFEPDRDATVPDFVIGPDGYDDVRDLKVSLADVRNRIEVFYGNAAGAQEPERFDNLASQAKYGIRYMGITEDSSSNIDTAVEAMAMATAAGKDLGAPPADQEVVLPFFWPVQLGDLVEFSPNGIHYDSAQRLGVVGVKHDAKAGEILTTLRVRGTVAGAFREWLKRGGGTGTETVGELNDFRRQDGTATSVLSWTRGRGVSEVWFAYAIIAAPETAAAWDAVAAAVAPLADGVDTLTVPMPGDGFLTLVQLEARHRDLSPGVTRRLVISGNPQAPIVELDDIETNTVGTQWWKITERGIPVADVSVQTQSGSNPVSDFHAPSRSAGAVSLVRGGLLGAGEYEQDVTLDADRNSYVIPRLTLANGAAPIVLGPFVFDRDKNPNLVSVIVSGTLLSITADSDTNSIRARNSAGTWEYFLDGQFLSVDVQTTGTNGAAGLGTSARDVFTIEAFALPKSDVDGSTAKDSTTRSISGPTATAAAWSWSVARLASPAIGSADATLTLKAAGAGGGYTVKITELDTSADVTSSMTPAISGPPSTQTDYTVTLGHQRAAPSDSATKISVNLRCDILFGAAVIDTVTVLAIYFTDA